MTDILIFPQAEYDAAVDGILKQNGKPMAALIARAQIDDFIVQRKKAMSEEIRANKPLAKEFERLGMKDDEEEVDLKDKCLWVPANINYVTKKCCVVYGGVLVQPRINVLQRGTQPYTDLARSSSAVDVRVSSQYITQAKQVVSAQMQGGSTTHWPTHMRFQEAAKAQAAAAAAATRTAPDPAPAAARPTTAFTPAPAPAPAARLATVVRPTTAPAPAPAPVRPTAASAAAVAGGASRGAGAAGASAQGGVRRGGACQMPSDLPNARRTNSPKRPAQLLPEIKVREIGTYRILADVDDSGKMPAAVSRTFAGGRYTRYCLEQELVVYKVGNSITDKGDFVTLIRPVSELQSRVDSAICHTWPGGGKSIIEVGYKLTLPAGTEVCVGEAGYQHSIFMGGTQQIYVNRSENPAIKVERFDIEVYGSGVWSASTRDRSPGKC